MIDARLVGDLIRLDLTVDAAVVLKSVLSKEIHRLANDPDHFSPRSEKILSESEEVYEALCAVLETIRNEKNV